MTVANELEGEVDAANGGNAIVLTVEVPETKKVSVVVTPSETVNVEMVLNPGAITNGVPKVLNVEGPEMRMVMISVTVAAVLTSTVQLAPLGEAGNWGLFITLELGGWLRIEPLVELDELVVRAEVATGDNELIELNDAVEDDDAIVEGLEAVDRRLVEVD